MLSKAFKDYTRWLNNPPAISPGWMVVLMERAGHFIWAVSGKTGKTELFVQVIAQVTSKRAAISLIEGVLNVVRYTNNQTSYRS